MSDKQVLRPGLWTPRPVEETIAVYADWAATYDAEVTSRGYRTPARLAAALSAVADQTTPLLDFGCGTGIGGAALRQAGFETIDGTDITKEMLARAAATGLYCKTWVSAADDMGFEHGDYAVIVAVGVISLGAAPPDTLAPLVRKLNSGGILALSYNDPTITDGTYQEALNDVCAEKLAQVIFREHGPHLEDVGMGSDVIILRRL